MSLHREDPGCERIAEDLERFVDGDLPRREVEAFSLHLESCGACRSELSHARAVRDELRALPALDAPAALIGRVKRQVRSEAAARGRFARWSPGWSRLRPSPVWALAAALLLVAVLVPTMMSTVPDELDQQPGADVAEAIDVERATAEARLALAYVGQYTRRTAFEIRDEVIVDRLVVPAAEGLSSLRGAPVGRAEGEGNET